MSSVFIPDYSALHIVWIYDTFALPPAGLWVELQLVYTGALQMTLQTKFNLSKLGKDGAQDTHCMTESPSSRSVP